MNKNRLDFTKGGRGKVAFYTTNLHRIPVPVKKYVEQISEIHKNSVANNRQDDFSNIMEAFFEQIEEVELSFDSQPNLVINSDGKN